MAYQKKVWKDLPNEETPLDEIGLNDWEQRIASAVDPVVLKTKQINSNGDIRVAEFLTPNSGVTAQGTIKVVRDDILNISYLFGRILTTESKAQGSTLLKLPSGYEPKFTQYFVCDSARVEGAVRVMVEATTGNLINMSPLSSGIHISLSGINYDIS